MGQDDVEVTIYTPEEAPLSMFGAAASAAVRLELHEVAVRVETGVFVQEGADGLLLQPGDRPLGTQRTVALPAAAGRRVAGLAVDERGFIPCDLHGKVAGTEAVWAAGDAIAFPIKQGGLAAQEAGAAAEAIAALAGCPIEPQPFTPVLRGVLLTGRGRQWMRNELGGEQGIVTRDHADLDRRALWWPPTKVAGRYLSPFLAGTATDTPAAPPGHPVDLDVGRDVAAAADALHMARLRDGENRARYALRRAEAGAEAGQREVQRDIDAYDRTLTAAKVKLRREGYLPALPARPGPPRPGRPERGTASS
jgi:sulfide:quinone oxidoreductase